SCWYRSMIIVYIVTTYHAAASCCNYIYTRQGIVMNIVVLYCKGVRTAIYVNAVRRTACSTRSTLRIPDITVCYRVVCVDPRCDYYTSRSCSRTVSLPARVDDGIVARFLGQVNRRLCAASSSMCIDKPQILSASAALAIDSHTLCAYNSDQRRR